MLVQVLFIELGTVDDILPPIGDFAVKTFLKRLASEAGSTVVGRLHRRGRKRPAMPVPARRKQQGFAD